MNYKFTAHLLGILALIESALLTIPLILSFVYGEDCWHVYLIVIAISLAVGIPLALIKPTDGVMQARGGFVTVALCWIEMSVIGCLPFILSGYVPNFVDALFETVSGFTTTGASIITDLDVIARSVIMWRALTHWIGGMGILLFVIALLPKAEGVSYEIFKAETPGPKAGKLVSKLRITAQILYLIYMAMTLICTLLLVLGGVSVFDSFCISFATASTGGFTPTNAGFGTYDSVYVETVVTVFMYLFAVNFTLHYFVIIGKVKDAVSSEELHWFTAIVLGAAVTIATCLCIENVYDGFWECLRISVEECVSVVTTTGFVFYNTETWSALPQFILFLLMFVGGCAGSTAGGLKVSRIMLLSKSGACELKSAVTKNGILNVKIDGKVVEKDVVQGTLRYFLVYLLLIIVSMVGVFIAQGPSVEPVAFTDGLGAVVSCVNNVGPGLYRYASGNFADFTIVSKIILIFDMLAGRLEILPLLMLFSPSSWRKK